MVSFLRNFGRSEPAPTPHNGDSRPSPAIDQHQLQVLVAAAAQAVEQLQSLAPVVETATALSAVAERLKALEGQAAAMEQLAPQFRLLEEQAERLARSQLRIETQMSNAAKTAERVEAQAGTVAHQLDLMVTVRDDLTAFAKDGQLQALNAETKTIRTGLGELTDGLTRVRAQYDDALRSQRHAATRVEAMDRQYQESASRVADLEGRVQQARQVLDQVHEAADGIPGVQHQLGVVKSVADQLSQRAAALEQQREAIERASAQAARFTELDGLIESGLRRQEEQLRGLARLEGQLSEIQDYQATVVTRAEVLRAGQGELEGALGLGRDKLAELREELARSTEQVELEHRGLDAARERVADLREALRDCENRLATLDTSRQGLEAVQAQAQALGGQITGLGAELSRTSQEAQRLHVVREDADRLDRLVQELAARMQRVEEVKATVETVARDFATLNGTHEAIRDGLEQMQLVYNEMSRQRESLAETEAWLANSDVWVRSLRHQVNEMSGMKPAMEELRAEVERVRESAEAIEARQPLVEEVQQHLGELAGLTAQLGERSEGLRNRMDVAEGRFSELAAQAEDARRVSGQIGAVLTSVAEADRRTASVGEQVAALEGRAQQLDGIGDRVRLLAQAMEQRQGALDKATEHLTQASSLRQEAADVTRQLELVLQGLREGLRSAGEQGTELAQLTGRLEGRGEGLRAAERRIAEFDELMARWEEAQAQATHTFEQLVGRQAALDALQSEVKHVFDLGERAVEDFRSISAARREIEETRTLLQQTQDQLREANQLGLGLEDRRRQLERTEQRLARAEALALDVRGSLEALQAQKVVVDQVVEQAGALSFQMKQAEALSAMLRQERTLAGQVRQAVDALRRDDPEPVGAARGDHG
jgi:chromosome segregation ATPase